MTSAIPNRALITGITGQDGSYLAEFLLTKGYEVHGLIRRASSFNTLRLDHIYQDPHSPGTKLFLHYGDLADSEVLSDIIYNVQPSEIYNLGAQSHVRVSFDIPEYTGEVSGIATTRILEAVRRSHTSVKLYQASSSEMFGGSPPPQNENTPLQPRSPYACAKAYSFWTARNYREGYGMWIGNGILFNHESPRRGQTFVTRKVAMGAVAIAAKKQNHLYVGNLDSKRDWGYAPEYVELMWRMLQRDKPEDFVVGTGVSHSVRELIELMFRYLGLNWERYVRFDKKYLRPTEVENLVADSAKARSTFNWKPKIEFEELVKIMVDAEMRTAGLDPPGEGDRALERVFPNRWWRVD